MFHHGSVMMLAAGLGCLIEIMVSSVAASPALEALCQLVEDNFEKP